MEALGQGMGVSGRTGHIPDLYQGQSSREDKNESNKVYGYFRHKSEISSLNTERGFMEDAAPETGHGDKGHGGIHSRPQESKSESVGGDKPRRY